jgi:hypothetical protein
MPGRFLRETILDSESVNSLSPLAELFYRRLMSAVDDFGRFDARLSVLRSRLYPVQLDRVAEDDVAAWLAECVQAGLVATYSVAGKPYLLFHKLGEPRARKGRFPPPPANESSCMQAHADESKCVQPPANESACTQTQTDAPPYALRLTPTPTPTPLRPPSVANGKGRPTKTGGDGFNRFWKAYPKKVKKEASLKAWAKIGPDAELVEVILAAIGRHKQTRDWQKSDGEFIPHPASWLNGRRWEDEPEAAPAEDGRLTDAEFEAVTGPTIHPTMDQLREIGFFDPPANGEPAKGGASC